MTARRKHEVVGKSRMPLLSLSKRRPWSRSMVGVSTVQDALYDGGSALGPKHSLNEGTPLPTRPLVSRSCFTKMIALGT